MLERLSGSDMNKLTVANMQVEALRKQIADAQATIADLQGQVEAAKAKLVDYETKTYCAFCGQTYLIDTGAELIARHIKECPKHPMRDVEQRVAQLEQALKAADELGEEYRADHARVLRLVQALPLVNGVLGVRVAEVELGNMWAITVDGYFDGNSALFETENEANAYMALLKYRASLPAQPAQGPVKKCPVNCLYCNDPDYGHPGHK